MLFIDFRWAFDSVNLKILVEKLIRKGVNDRVTNTIIKLINSSQVSVDLIRTISVNSGTGQGKLTSPLLFDIYIDDLLDDVGLLCELILAFADDTAMLCNSREQLENTMIGVDEWCRRNKIAINHKKSGILIFNSDGKDTMDIRGYPVVNYYKYLGILMDHKLDPKRHIKNLNKKLNVYFAKYKMIHRKYFSPYSLTRIIDYFVKSRISYGLCCYLDQKAAMSEINLTLLKHLKKIFGLPDNTSHTKLSLVMGEPDLRIRLAVRLLKNWHKYRNHFGMFPEKYREVLLEYFDQEVLESEEGTDYDVLKNRLIDEHLRKVSEENLGFAIRPRHREFVSKFIFTHSNLGDFHLIRYYTGTCVSTNIRLFENCSLCGKEKVAVNHAANECEMILGNRKKLIREIEGIFKKNDIPREAGLHEYLLKIFFVVTKDHIREKADLRRLIEMNKLAIWKIVRREK
jgi:hypothetical protein